LDWLRKPIVDERTFWNILEHFGTLATHKRIDLIKVGGGAKRNADEKRQKTQNKTRHHVIGIERENQFKTFFKIWPL